MMPLLASRLPPTLCLLIQSRLASSVSSQGRNIGTFPFPEHRNPTPHEIFHLPRGASQSAIKSRYYELVRIYHPDSPTARNVLASTSHARFQAISSAYALLTGKKLLTTTWSRDAPYEEELLRRRRAQWRASASSDEFGNRGYGGGVSSMAQEEREKWDQRLMVFIVLLVITTTILPVSILSPFAARKDAARRHEEASKNLAHARQMAREMPFVRWSGKRREERGASNPSETRSN